jgi:hypothetical protein
MTGRRSDEPTAAAQCAAFAGPRGARRFAARLVARRRAERLVARKPVGQGPREERLPREAQAPGEVREPREVQGRPARPALLPVFLPVSLVARLRLSPTQQKR